jgi:hypothetical protein
MSYPGISPTPKAQEFFGNVANYLFSSNLTTRKTIYGLHQKTEHTNILIKDRILLTIQLYTYIGLCGSSYFNQKQNINRFTPINLIPRIIRTICYHKIRLGVFLEPNAINTVFQLLNVPKYLNYVIEDMWINGFIIKGNAAKDTPITLNFD